MPADRLTVTESGIRTHRDIERLGCFAEHFLIGSAIGLTADLSVGVRELLFGESKCCGITRAEDALAAVSVGLITAKRSSRYVAPDRLAALAADIRRLTTDAGLPVRIAAVADAHDAEALNTLQGADFDTLQLHGEVTDDELKALRDRFPGKRLVLAVGMNDLTDDELAHRIHRANALIESGLADRILLDAAVGGKTGGTGRTLDTALPGRFARPDRILLAGGLSPANTRDAAASGAAGLDFNSGLEIRPGIKSRKRIQNAFLALRGNPILQSS